MTLLPIMRADGSWFRPPMREKGTFRPGTVWVYSTKVLSLLREVLEWVGLDWKGLLE